MMERRSFLLGSTSLLATSRALAQIPGGEATIGGCFGAPANTEACGQGPVVSLDLTQGNTPLFQANVSFTRASTATYFDSTGTLQTAAINAARFPYAYNGSAWVPQGFLVEAAAANLYLNSQAPALQTITVANATQYTISFYGTGSIAYSGAATGTLSGTGANVLSSVTITSATTSLVVAAPVGSVTNVQVETGAVATSRIITGASTASRSPDVAQATGKLLATLQGAAGSLISETNSLTGSPAVIVSSQLSSYYFGYVSPYLYAQGSGPTLIHVSNTYPALASPRRQGLAWSSSGRSISDAGGIVASDTAVQWPTLTSAYIGSDGGTSFFIGGNISRLAAWNSRLPNSTLQAKTVLGAPF